MLYNRVMPSRNVLKVDVEDSYYHVYARGASRADIFLDEEDFLFFQQLFIRYLSPRKVVDSARVPYNKLTEKIELLCYVQMNNHFHLLVYQKERSSMRRLMQSVMGSYVLYFNKKYNKTGSLFESRYKAAIIDNTSYLEHITRYIHLNPFKNWNEYPYSSIHNYKGKRTDDWLNTARVLSQFRNRSDYLRFTADNEEAASILAELKFELASTSK